MKILFILLFIIYPKLVFSDPMNVVDDWELLDNSFSKELFSSNKEYKLFIEDSESLVLLNTNNNEQCDIATIDELDNIFQEEGKKNYRIFYLDDGSLQIFNGYNHFVIENIESIFAGYDFRDCRKYKMGKITIQDYVGKVRGVINSCFKEESMGESFNNNTTKRYHNSFLVSQWNSYVFGMGRIDASEDKNKLVLDQEGRFLGIFPSVSHILYFCDVYDQIVFTQE